MEPVKHLQLGDKVTFSHHWDRPTREEIELVAEDSSTITLMRRENQTPGKLVVVVGISRVAFEAPIDENDYGTVYAAWSSAQTKSARFYVVKHSLRGRRFLVKPEDVTAAALHEHTTMEPQGRD